MKNLCGIDEAGRGPLAGPLVVAGVILIENIVGLNDSKVLSKKKRELLFDEIIEKSKYHIVFKSAKEIDDFGISSCLKSSILEIIENLKEFSDYFLMDGNTNFGIKILQKEIKADAKYAQVSAASILAKVSRDRFMVEISKDFKEFDFEKHKGYGTKAHIEAIKKFGRSPIHRTSYKIKGIDDKENLAKSLFEE
jgi:ribonuclease HII